MNYKELCEANEILRHQLRDANNKTASAKVLGNRYREAMIEYRTALKQVDAKKVDALDVRFDYAKILFKPYD